jgi:hypothetical protein
MFKDMINVTSHVKHGISIPSHKLTHAEIMHMFKEHIMKLKAELNVHMHSSVP